MAATVRFVSIASLVAGIAACAAPPFDHYDPAVLHAAALERAGAGDVASARVLLTRAARLAPHDARVARSLRELEAGSALSPSPAEPAPSPRRSAPPPAAPPPAVPLEPPALWPPK